MLLSYCSRHKKSCTGQPCTSPSPTTFAADDEPMQCVSGWSEWISSDHPIPGKKDSDLELLPSTNQLFGVVKGIKVTSTLITILSYVQCIVKYNCVSQL